MPATTKSVSPIGSDVSAEIAWKKKCFPEYAAAAKKLAFAENFARTVIAYRMEHGLTQKRLAAMLSMTAPEVSRLEGGLHAPSIPVILRVLAVLHKRIAFVDDNVGATLAWPAQTIQTITPKAVRRLKSGVRPETSVV